MSPCVDLTAHGDNTDVDDPAGEIRLFSGRVERLVVVGCAGSGKSTLASALSMRTGLPVVERDGLGRLGSDAYRDAVERITREQRWIFDGAPYFIDDLVYGLADAVVILDYRKTTVMWRVLRRTLRVELLRRPAGAHQPVGLAGLRDRAHPLRWAWISHRDRHDECLALVDRPDLAGSQIVHLTSPRAARRWLRDL